MLRRLTLVVGLLLPGLIYWWLNWRNDLAGFYSDAVQYLYMADWFSQLPDPSPRVSEVFAGSFYPPLFPWLLSLFQGGVDDIVQAHHIAAILLASSAPVAWLWMRRLGLPSLHALFLTLCALLCSKSLSHSFYVSSETLYLPLTLATLWLLTPPGYSRGRSRCWTFAIAAVLIGAASITRSIGLTLVIALLIHFLARCGDPSRVRVSAARFVGLLLIALLPSQLWSRFSSGLREGESYLGQFLTHYEQIPIEHIPGYLAGQTLNLLRQWPLLFTAEPMLWQQIIAWLLLAGCLLAALVRLLRLEMDGLYLWGYLGLLVIWPFPAEADRFWLPLLPILLGLGGWGVWQIAGGSAANQYRLNSVPKVTAERWIGLPILLLLLLAVPPAALNLWRFSQPLPDGLESLRHTPLWINGADRGATQEELTRLQQIREAVMAIDTAMADDSTLCSAKTNRNLLMLHVVHRVIYLPNDLHRRSDIEDQLAPCDYVFMSRIQMLQLDLPPMYPGALLIGRARPIFVSNGLDDGVQLAALVRMERD